MFELQIRRLHFYSPTPSELFPVFDAYSYFLSSNIANLEQYPFLILQFALNMPDDHIVYRDAINQKLVDILPWADEHITDLCVYNHVTKVQSESPCIHTLLDDSGADITCIKLTDRAKFIISGNSKGKVVIWELKSGQAVYTLDMGAGVSDIIISNDWPTYPCFSFVVSTLDGYIRVFWLKMTKSGLQMEKLERGPVWKAHSLSEECLFDAFHRVPIAISKNKCLISSGARSFYGDDVERSLTIWDTGVCSGAELYPSKVVKLCTIKGGTLLGEEGVYENFPLIQMSPEGYVCIAVERADKASSSGSFQVNSQIVVCRVEPFEKVFVSEQFQGYPTAFSMHNGRYALFLAMILEHDHIYTFQVMEFDYELKMKKGKVIFESREYKTKTLNQIALLDCDHVVFNLGAGLVNTKLDYTKYLNYLPVYLPGHASTVTCIAPTNNFDNDLRDGLIATADSRSIKVLNRRKLLEFQSQTNNDRCVHPGPVKAIAVASEVRVVATAWVNILLKEQMTEASVMFWNACDGLPLVLPGGIEFTEINEHINDRGDLINIKLALSADGRVVCVMHVEDENVSIYTTENIRSSEPTLLQCFTLEGLKWSRGTDNILNILPDGSKLLAASGSGTKQSFYLGSISESAPKYSLKELPISGEIKRGALSLDGQYVCIVSVNTATQQSRATFKNPVVKTTFITLYSTELYREIAKYEVSPDDIRPDVYNRIDCSVTAVDFLPDAKHLVTAHDHGKLQVYSVPDLKPEPEFTAHKKKITGVCSVCHKGVFYIVTSSLDGWVKIWRFPDLSLVAMHYNASPVTCVSACSSYSSFTLDDMLFIQYGDPDGRLEVLEINPEDSTLMSTLSLESTESTL